jgi:hypothetical protein
MQATSDIPLRDGEQWADLFPRIAGVTAGAYRGLCHRDGSGRLVALFPAASIDEMTSNLPLAQYLGDITWVDQVAGAVTVQQDPYDVTPAVLVPDERGLYDLSRWPWTIRSHPDGVVNAAEAARRLQAAFPSADLLVFFPPANPSIAVELELWNDTTGELLWDSGDDQPMADQATIRALLAAADTADPAVFEPGELPGDRHLRLNAVLEADAMLAAQRLAAHAIDDLGLSPAAVAALVNDVAAETAGRHHHGGSATPNQDWHDDVSPDTADANTQQLLDQIRSLLDRLGEYEAWLALENTPLS